MNIAIQTRPWGPEANRHSLPAILAEIAGCDYAGFEIGAQHLDTARVGRPARPDILRGQAAAAGLQVVGIHIGGEIYDPAGVQAMLHDLDALLDYIAAVGAPFVPFSGRMKTDKTAAELQQQADALNRIGRLCAARGLRLAYHNHFWEIENDCAELHHLCDHTDPALVGLCLDVGWVQRAGGTPADVTRTFLDRIAYFHIKDTTPAEWREVGHGDLDFPTLFAAIPRRDDLWLVVEQDETRRPPVESAQMSRDVLQRLLGL